MRKLKLYAIRCNCGEMCEHDLVSKSNVYVEDQKPGQPLNINPFINGAKEVKTYELFTKREDAEMVLKDIGLLATSEITEILVIFN